MCGIAGYSGNGTMRDLSAAAVSLSHRGPDSSGVYVSQTHDVGLAHTRLSIIDLSSLGHQPMVSADGNFVLIFNGEIYNHMMLRASLEARGHVFRGSSDTETLLELLAADGLEALSKLNGMFAFALLDIRSGELTIVRDASGVKPLYIGQDARGLVFGSEIKALIALGLSLEAPDAAALNRYLTFLWCPGEGTPARNVRKLAPGEAMLVSNGEIKKKWIWRAQQAMQAMPATATVETLAEELADRLRSAVRSQMLADVPVGAFLSGGLDSSAVVAFAREVTPAIRCFTIEIEGGAEAGLTDDLPYAKVAASHLDVPLEVIPIDARRMAQDVERLVFQLDEPLADPAALSVLYISEAARKNGIKVLLSGAGGDDLFSGYSRHRALEVEKVWRWIPLGLRQLAQRVSAHFDQRNARFRRATKFLNRAALEGDENIINYFVWIGRKDLEALYTKSFRDAVGESAAGQPMLDYISGMSASASALDRMLALEQRFFLADHNLIYTDKMSMAAGVEVRVPFLDPDLVAFASTVPPAFKQHGQTGKWILKKAMEPYLPKEIIYRPKAGFGAPVRRWMRTELRGWMRDILSEESLQRRGMFEPAAVRELMNANDAGRIDASYTLLSLVCVELWMRRIPYSGDAMSHDGLSRAS